MKTSLSKSLILLTLLILLSSCMSTEEKTVSQQNSQSQSTTQHVASIKELGIEFTYPQTWEGSPVADKPTGTAFIPTRKECDSPCSGLSIRTVAAKQNEYEFNVDTKMISELTAENHVDVVQKIEARHPTILVTGQPGTTDEHSTLYVKPNEATLFEMSFLGTPTFTKSDANIIAKSFQLIPIESTVAQARQLTGSEIPFDGCGKPGAYAKEDFMTTFDEQLGTIPSAQLPYEINTIGNKKKLSLDSLDEMCVSKDKTTIIAIVSGDYCSLGKLLQYDVVTHTIYQADTTSARSKTMGSCDITLKSFGKRTGAVVAIEGLIGDAGVQARGNYEYNYQTGELSLKEICRSEANEETGKMTPEVCKAE